MIKPKRNSRSAFSALTKNFCVYLLLPRMRKKRCLFGYARLRNGESSEPSYAGNFLRTQTHRDSNTDPPLESLRDTTQDLGAVKREKSTSTPTIFNKIVIQTPKIVTVARKLNCFKNIIKLLRTFNHYPQKSQHDSIPHGISVYEYVSQMDASPDVVDVFNKFYPGLWQAVECENIYQVRQLINYWCRTKLQKNGLLLKDIALETGNEEIINLILGVCESMDLVYHIFARNTQAVKKKLEMHRKKLRLNLRKMSDHGAPILYYLIQSRDVPTIQLFMENDCQIYTIMQDEMGNDMPVLFSALRSDMTVVVLEALLPKGKVQLEEILYKILYKGKTVLQVAMEKGVSKEIFKLLVDRGGPLLLCDRNQFNQTVRDIAVSLNQHLYVSAIDEVAHDWIVNSAKYINRREKLAFFGWKFEPSQYMENRNLDEGVSEFLSELNLLQAQIKNLSLAIENGDISKLIELKTAKHLSHFRNMDLLWYARVVGDGIPLLHRAVLHNQPEIVEMILDEKPLKESIDNLFDQHHRTALHYAFACSSTKKIQKLLLNCGCSEHVLDKNNKEPLDFKDKQDAPAVFQLLNRLKLKNFPDFEPDPWNNISVEQVSSHCQEENACNVDSTHTNLYHSCDWDENANCESDYNDGYFVYFDSDSELEISEEEEESRSQCSIF